MAIVPAFRRQSMLFALSVAAPSVAILAGFGLANRLNWIEVAAASAVIFAAVFCLARLLVVDLSRLWRMVENDQSTPDLRLDSLDALGRLATRRIEAGATVGAAHQTAASALDRLIEILPVPVLLVDDDRRLVRINEAARSLVEREGQSRDLANSVRVPALIEAVDAVRAGGKPVSVEFKAPGPAERILRADFVTLDLPVAGTARIAILLQDLTAMKRIDQMRVDFVANVSHELKTPLSSLIGFIETLRGPASSDIDARERFLEIMEEQASRMARLIEDLMSLSRIEMEESRRPSEQIAVLPILQQVAEALQPQANARQMHFEIHPPADGSAPGILGDVDQITQVIQNLLDNAIKYGRPGTPVTITLSRRTDQDQDPTESVSVAVTDRGDGIPEDQIERLTERFYRVDTARSRQLGGTGLGLAIVKHIMQRHGGKLEIASAVGEGSTFTAHFPAGSTDRA